MAKSAARTRKQMIADIEKQRGSRLICFLTTLRPGVAGQIADDQVRVLFDHLLKLPKRRVEKLDLFLVSNGGNGVVPWRIVSLLREFSETFRVLIPYRAYSAASLIALGADEIVMHPFGELGPIDPSVSNDFNPRNAQGQPLAISVEDVKAYINFIKKTVGITHEDELVKTIEALCNQVHPLALGNVERFVSQSRMIATKVLKTHMNEAADHIIDEMVENMTSKLYFHGHPINRVEAKNDLKLKVADCPAILESLMWRLYLDFEKEFENTVAFNPVGALVGKAPPAPVVAGQPPQPVTVESSLIHAMIQSSGLKSTYVSKRRNALIQTPTGPQLQDFVLEQGWSHSPA